MIHRTLKDAARHLPVDTTLREMDTTYRWAIWGLFFAGVAIGFLLGRWAL